MSVYLFGGGWNPGGWSQTFRRFLDSTVLDGRRRIALIVHVESDDEGSEACQGYRRAFAALGVPGDEIAELLVAPARPLSRAVLADARPTAIFVGGGLTPAYQEALCLDQSWLDVLQEHQLPYAGFSAGAVIAARHALVGGWQALREGTTFAVAPPEAAEDLELLEVRPGLGLVPFTVDVHATQWGTLTRLLHAVDLGLVSDGCAIDEDTLLQVRDGNSSVFGLGHVYRISRSQGRAQIEIEAGRAI